MEESSFELLPIPFDITIAPNDHFRLYAGACPLLIWAKGETESEKSTPDYITSAPESDIGTRLYARTGLFIFLTKQLRFFAGAHVTDSTLSFKDDIGTVYIEGYQYYGSHTFHFSEGLL